MFTEKNTSAEAFLIEQFYGQKLVLH